MRRIPLISTPLLLAAVTLAAPSVCGAADAAGPDAGAAADAAQTADQATADQGAGADATVADNGVHDQVVKLDTIRPRPANPEGCDCRVGAGPAGGVVAGPLLLLGLVLVVRGWRARR